MRNRATRSNTETTETAHCHTCIQQRNSPFDSAASSFVGTFHPLLGLDVTDPSRKIVHYALTLLQVLGQLVVCFIVLFSKFGDYHRPPFTMQVTHHLPLRTLGPTHNYVAYGAPFCPPPCECPDCQNHFYTREEQHVDRFCYKAQISDAEAGKILETYLTNIRNDRKSLQMLCELHGDKIMNRWKKKSRDQRKAWLLQAEPDLYHHQWFLPRYTYTDPHWRDARKHRKTFLLPYLNVEVLRTNPAVLFGLLWNRTHYSPEDWAPFDNKELTISWAAGFYDLEYCGSCVIMYGPRYGKLTPWEPKAAHRSDIVGFPRARLIIEAQACLLGFLRRVVDQILEGCPEAPTSSVKWVEMARMGFKKSGDVAFWSQYTYQPFSAPPVFDIDALLSQAKARIDATGDHMWLLQTDPSYLRYQVRLINEGQGIKGSERSKAYRMIVREICHDVMVHWFWQWVYDELENARTWCLRYKDHIHAGEALPREYDQALGALELLLVNAMHSRSKHLQAIIPQRPGFRHLWAFEYDDAKEQIRLERKSKTKVTELFYEDPLDWCLMQLQGEPDAQRRFDHAMLFNFLDDYLSTCSARERARLDTLLWEKLSDYAAIHEMLVTVRLHRPQNTNRKLGDVFEHDDRKAWRHFNKYQDLMGRDEKALAVVLEKFCEKPVPSGPQDRAWLNRFDAMHKALEEFWDQVHRRYRTNLGQMGLSANDVQSDLETLSMCKSPAYLKAVQVERERSLAYIDNVIAPPNRDMSSLIPHGSNESQDNVALQIRESKAKVKTRGKESITAVDLSGPEEESSATQEPSRAISVNQRTFNIFTAMFPASSEEAAKSVDWDTFVHAMADVGFSARNGGGSAVMFEKGKDGHSGLGGRIIFHRPHPNPKIHPVMLHSMGRRMMKWFGWHRGLFVRGNL